MSTCRGRRSPALPKAGFAWGRGRQSGFLPSDGSSEVLPWGPLPPCWLGSAGIRGGTLAVRGDLSCGVLAHLLDALAVCKGPAATPPPPPPPHPQAVTAAARRGRESWARAPWGCSPLSRWVGWPRRPCWRAPWGVRVLVGRRASQRVPTGLVAPRHRRRGSLSPLTSHFRLSPIKNKQMLHPKCLDKQIKAPQQENHSSF